MGKHALFYILFNPNKGLKNPILLISNSYIAKHPMLVKATTKMNCNIVGISSENTKKDAMYKNIICII